MKKKFLICIFVFLTTLSSCEYYPDISKLDINISSNKISKNENLKINITGKFSNNDKIRGLQLSLFVMSENQYSCFNLSETSLSTEDNSTKSFNYYVLSKGYDDNETIQNIDDYFIINIPKSGEYSLLIISELSGKKTKYFSKGTSFEDFSFNITVTE